MLSKIITVLLAVIGILYPVIVFACIKYYSLNVLLGVLGSFFAIRLLLLLKSKSQFRKPVMAVCCIALILCGCSYILKASSLVLYYPVVVNLIFLGIFSLSLRGKSLVTRIAELQDPHLSDFARNYTRKVTWIWCLFFILNGLISYLTILSGDINIWTWYNGCISYILMGSLALGEYLLRIYLRRHYEKN